MNRFGWCVYPMLREALNRTKHTRKTLADAVGISPSNIWFWLSGGNERTIRKIQKILDAAGLTFEEAFKK